MLEDKLNSHKTLDLILGISKIAIPLPLPLKYWDYRHKLPHMAERSWREEIILTQGFNDSHYKSHPVPANGHWKTEFPVNNRH